MARSVLHLDIDAFLASIEQIVEPSLRGRPVAVGSGVVASRSYEAKARGVHTAMAVREALRVCPELVVRDGDAALAERFRAKVAEVVRRFTPLVQVCSLDDLYADLGGVPLPEGGPAALAARIRTAVRVATGLSVAQGIGTSKVVARVATTHAKPGGIRVVAPGEEVAFLAPHALRDLPGIGAGTAAILESHNLHTIGDLLAVERDLLVRTFGARGAQLYWRARGLDDDPAHAAAPVPEAPSIGSLSRETSFEPTLEGAFLHAMLGYLLDRAAAELRAQRLVARTVHVKVRHVDGVEGARSRTLAAATDRTDLLGTLAHTLLHELRVRRVLVRLVGVALQQLVPQGPRQGTLFGQEAERRRALFAAVDAVRARHGFGKLVLGQAGALLGVVRNTRQGFRLRTPSLAR
ncbi:MAG: DNA polymerase IV [Planctomycetes bacterium]|nr:DNA polymerase IV [Planctomycetota bacterium]